MANDDKTFFSNLRANEEGAELTTGCLFGMGNPLLDISAVVSDDMLEKYKLKANDAILAGDDHKGICKDLVENFSVDYIPGGATQNSIKIVQWMIGLPNFTTYMGCISKDDFGAKMLEKSTALGVNVQFQYTDKQPTGTCACLITGTNHENRSLVADLAAANCFTKHHLDKAENKALMEKARFYYIAGFFLTVSPESMTEIGEHASQHNKLFMMNLSAPFLCQFFKSQMENAFKYVDVLFGNETEAEIFAKEILKVPEDSKLSIQEIVLKAAQLEKVNSKRKRIVVVTQGASCTVVACGGRVTEYPVIACLPEEVVDTNGAGDAFVGGFLAQLVRNKAIDECVRAAHWSANVVIKRHGCTFPNQCDFK